MQPWAEGFYKSYAWQQCRAAYAKSVGGLCERCLQRGLYTPGEIVHHKIHLTRANITDPKITSSFDNLCLLCRACHEEVHRRPRSYMRYAFDKDGRVIIPPEGP